MTTIQGGHVFSMNTIQGWALVQCGCYSGVGPYSVCLLFRGGHLFSVTAIQGGPLFQGWPLFSVAAIQGVHY